MGTWVNRSQGLQQAENKWWLSTGMSESRVTAVYQPLGSPDIAQSYVNLSGATQFNASPIVSPTFATASGWTFTGTQHLTTNITGNGLQTILIRVAAPNPAARMSITGYSTVSRKFYFEVDNIFGIADNYFPAYNATETASAQNNNGDEVLGLARNSFYFNGTFVLNTGSLDTWSEGTITIGLNLVGASTKYIGDIYAYAVYADQLSASEVSEITTAMAALTSTDDPVPDPFPVNWIVQNPATKRLNSSSHELWAATDGGIFRTIDGGRGWAKITLPDPSNAEFLDTPAATVDELTFHWIDYNPTDELTLLVYAAKAATSRIWGYKTTDLGLNWTSRGVVVA